MNELLQNVIEYFKAKQGGGWRNFTKKFCNFFHIRDKANMITKLVKKMSILIRKNIL